ncbi:hypothetical protein JG688_00017933 [Phytophthora aleatoria]|uniref:Uncharacterized protein n=1 Tax=Phytophthora aleatoria TaxID=2496075 RepID=A0A8J5IWN6_9STRA|nr:hypothetical protein JG688_00017933 [Phytophthora aleatoria]
MKFPLITGACCESGGMLATVRRWQFAVSSRENQGCLCLLSLASMVSSTTTTRWEHLTGWNSLDAAKISLTQSDRVFVLTQGL